MFKRPSNRNFDELRNITLEANFSPYAERWIKVAIVAFIKPSEYIPHAITHLLVKEFGLD